MAVTRIHAVKKRVSSAIEYIINPAKTDDGFLVTSHLCNSEPHQAERQFSAIRNGIGRGKATTKAQHIIQSFAHDEVTPEQALLIGQELCEKLLKDNYQYVLAVHTDHDHIHCHVIFNNVNAFTGNTFETEYNQGKKSERAWAKVREVSDKICKENGLSVIEEPKGKGVSHYERDMQKEGKSWKEKLRYKLAKIILKSNDFDDFLRHCDEKGIEAVYTPDKKVKMKYRLEGQERFTRADTLGEEYLPENIAENIKLIQKAVTDYESKKIASEPVSNKKVSAPVSVSETPEIKTVVSELIPQKKAEKDMWSGIRGMGNSSAMIDELESVGIMSLSDFWNFYHSCDSKTKRLDNMIQPLSKDIDNLKILISKVNTCIKLQPIMKEYYNRNGLAKTLYKKKHSAEIESYTSADSYIKSHSKPFLMDEKLPKKDILELGLKEMIADYNALTVERNTLEDKKEAVFRYSRKIKNYQYQQTNKRQCEQSIERSLQRKKNGYGIE